MRNFSVQLNTSIGRRVFYFRQIFVLQGLRYHVMVFGRITNNYFSMVHQDEQWQFAKPALIEEWILQVLDQLIKAIEDHHNNESVAES